MEQATGIDVDLGQLFDTPTIAELLVSLGPQAAKNSSLVIPLRTGDYRVPIFCLVGIDLYAEFAESLGKGQPVFGVYVAEERALTHEFVRGNAPEISVEKLAQAYYRAILRVRPQGPYRLAGLSLGGIVAMELASKMRRNGADVDVVMLFDTWLPEAIHHRWLKWLSLQAATIGRGHAWPMLVRLLTRLRTRLATNRLNNVDNIRVLREAAFVHSIKKWRADQRDFDFRVLLFRASDRREWGPHVEVDADYGWRRYLGERISIVDVDGDHLSMLKQPNVVALGRKAQQYLLSDQAFRAEL
jgi:thioesterase domain-containing protein